MAKDEEKPSPVPMADRVSRIRDPRGQPMQQQHGPEERARERIRAEQASLPHDQGI